MLRNRHEALRTEMRSIIGNDILTLGAADPKYQNFTGIELATGYGAALLMAFVVSAGEKAGAALWRHVSARLSKAKRDVSRDAKTQLRQIKSADDALSLVARELSLQYIDAFLASGREAVRLRLQADKFDDDKAERISSAIAEAVAKRLRP